MTESYQPLITRKINSGKPINAKYNLVSILL